MSDTGHFRLTWTLGSNTLVKMYEGGISSAGVSSFTGGSVVGLMGMVYTQESKRWRVVG